MGSISPIIQKYYLNKQDLQPLEELKENIKILFGGELNQKFPITLVFGHNLSEINQNLRSARASTQRDMAKYVTSMYEIILKLANGAVKSQSGNSFIPLLNLKKLINLHFIGNSFIATKSKNLIEYQTNIENKEIVRESLRPSLESDLIGLFGYLHKQLTGGEEMRKDIFICYARKDNEAREQIQNHLIPYFRNRNITVWDDTKIKMGQDWDKEIKQSLQKAKVAILLVSSDFMSSNYIYENELPAILNASQNEGLEIVWILIRPTQAWKYMSLKDIQCAHRNVDSKGELEALSELPEHQRERILANIAEKISGLFL